EAEHLIPAAVGENRLRPADEAMQPAAARDQVVAGPQVQVIGVAQQDLGAERFEVAMRDALHRALRPNRHEGRRLDFTVRRAQNAATREVVGVRDPKRERGHTMSIVGALRMTKLRVGVIYGGRSGEHEVSLASAASVFQNLDPAKYEAVPILIGKDGRWALPDRAPTTMKAAEVIADSRGARLAAAPADREAHLVAYPGGDTLLTIDRNHSNVVSGLGLDVVFPVLHGPYGEDGTVQGLLELANVPYVGAGVLASAVGMDKAVMKLVFAAKGLSICDYQVVLKRDWQCDERAIMTTVADRLGFPVFVKPANLGSSVGISKARHATELREAI